MAPAVFDALDRVYDLKALQRRAWTRTTRLWPRSRPTLWRRVAGVMRVAPLDGPQATPAGVRHGLGVQAVTKDLPLNMMQKWLGHAQFSTIAIYSVLSEPKEQESASRMWQERT